MNRVCNPLWLPFSRNIHTRPGIRFGFLYSCIAGLPLSRNFCVDLRKKGIKFSVLPAFPFLVILFPLGNSGEVCSD